MGFVMPLTADLLFTAEIIETSVDGNISEVSLMVAFVLFSCWTPTAGLFSVLECRLNTRNPSFLLKQPTGVIKCRFGLYLFLLLLSIHCFNLLVYSNFHDANADFGVTIWFSITASASFELCDIMATFQIGFRKGLFMIVYGLVFLWIVTLFVCNQAGVLFVDFGAFFCASGLVCILIQQQSTGMTFALLVVLLLYCIYNLLGCFMREESVGSLTEVLETCVVGPNRSGFHGASLPWRRGILRVAEVSLFCHSRMTFELNHLPCCTCTLYLEPFLQ